MKYLGLVWAGIWRKRIRAVLTLLTIVSAFLLFGLLHGFNAGLTRTAADTRADILISYSRVSQYEPLPLRYAEQIQQISGVTAVTPAVVFESTYRTPNQSVAAFAVDADKFLAVYPRMGVTDAQIEALTAKRTGALVSEAVARTFGWKVGDRIPLRSRLWLNRDGTPVWQVDIVGIYTPIGAGAGGNPMLLNYDYVDEGRPVAKGTTNYLFMKLASSSDAARVSREIDQRFANSDHGTKTVTESQLALESMQQIGDVGLVVNAIVSAIFFALLFSVGAAMSQSVRDRTHEFAILKTLGFTDTSVLSLVLTEAVLFCTVAAAIGLGFAALIFPMIERQFGFDIQAGSVFAVGLLLSAGLALLAGLPPALRARRLQVVDALAGR
ncbi:MAG: ABC transporter permease [Sphingomonas sp.]|nr:MAG: ABC transporter permease [Sphingomonas sp.]